MNARSIFRKFVLVLLVISASIFIPKALGKSTAGPWYVAPGGSDSDDCLSVTTPCATINGAVEKASSGDTIYVAEGLYTNTGAAVVTLDKNVTLSGGWKTDFTSRGSFSTLDGQSLRRGMIIENDVMTTIEKFEIINGLGDSMGGGGGMMISDHATVTLTDSIIHEIQTYDGISAWYADLTVTRTTVSNAGGDGILNYLGTLRVESSTVIDNDFGILSNGDAFIENSTISGNTYGGIGLDCSGNIDIRNSTITQNHEFGLRTYWCNNAVLQNTILAGNIGADHPDCSGPFQSNGYNIIGETTGCDFTPTTGDLVNIDANLGAPLDNGGSTPTHALLPGSPAIDAGNPAGCEGFTQPLITDQRQAPRKGNCDIGAYEFGGTLVSLSASANPSNLGQPVTLTAEVLEGEDLTPTGTVTFADEGGNLGMASLDGAAQASLEVNNLSLGNHIITATYSGDSNFAGSTSPELYLTVKYSTEISITADDPDPSVVGQPINVSFRVVSDQGTPSGMVSVATDESQLCSTGLTNGLGSCQISLMETGLINLTATYIGDEDFNTSATTESHTVNKADTTTIITYDTPDPSGAGQRVAIGFTVTASSPGAGIPTGQVAITTDDGQESCSGVLVDGSGDCQIALTQSGPRTLVASYEGDNLFNHSVSGGQPHFVNLTSYLPAVFKPCPPLFMDDFSDPASDWPVGDDGKIRLEYLNQEYRTLVRPTRSGVIARPGLQASEYSVMVDLRNSTGVMGSYGIAFGIAQDWSTFYTLEIYPDGWYGIYRYDPNTVVTLSEAYSPAIYQGSATNLIRVERSGASINTYANGQLLASVTDGSYTGFRYIGLIVFSYEQRNVDIRFDNFTVNPISCGGLNTALNTTNGELEFLGKRR